MGGQTDIRADTPAAGMAGAAVGRGLATLLRRLAPGYDGQRPAGLIADCICVCAGELPQAGAAQEDGAADVLAAQGRLRGPVKHLVHGSARSCWEYACCPVVVVPPGEGAGR